jgi:hypothetical protein
MKARYFGGEQQTSLIVCLDAPRAYLSLAVKARSELNRGGGLLRWCFGRGSIRRAIRSWAGKFSMLEDCESKTMSSPVISAGAVGLGGDDN